MAETHVIVKYHNARMFSIVDQNLLIATLFHEFGDEVEIAILPMDDKERRLSSHKEAGGLLAVGELFQVFNVQDGMAQRRSDIEDAVIAKGQK